LGHAELRGIGCDDQVARAHQPETTRQRMTVHARNDRLTEPGHVFEEIHERSAEGMLLDFRLLSGETTEIAAGAEGLVPLARENHDTDGIVFTRFREGAAQLGHDGNVEGVPLFGAVDRDPRHRRGYLVASRGWFFVAGLPRWAGSSWAGRLRLRSVG